MWRFSFFGVTRKAYRETDLSVLLYCRSAGLFRYLSLLYLFMHNYALLIL